MDYIEREKVWSALNAACVPYNRATAKAIESIPAADVRPVVRGKWIDHQEGRWIYAKCSECGTLHDVKSNFCPNCGADMRNADD